MIRRPPRSTQSRSSAASDVYKRQSEGDRDEKARGAQQGDGGHAVGRARDPERRGDEQRQNRPVPGGRLGGRPLDLEAGDEERARRQREERDGDPRQVTARSVAEEGLSRDPAERDGRVVQAVPGLVPPDRRAKAIHPGTDPFARVHQGAPRRDRQDGQRERGGEPVPQREVYLLSRAG